MANIGAEVGQKMRSAIKAKLLELNCYVDDELPDYVMVMVANKRTKSQMKEDLQLFLAAKTATFVDWLHIVLKKLKEVTVTNPEVYKKTVKRKSDETVAVNIKKEKKDKKLEKKIKKVEPAERTVVSDETLFQSLTDDLPINANRLSEQRKIIIMKENQSNNSAEQVIQDNFDIPLLSEVNMSTEEELEDIEKKIKSVKSRLGLLVESDEDDCINLKTESDELFAADPENKKSRKIPDPSEASSEAQTLKRPERTRITFDSDETESSTKRKSVLERLGKRRSNDNDEDAASGSKKSRISEFRKDEDLSKTKEKDSGKEKRFRNSLRSKRDSDKPKEVRSSILCSTRTDLFLLQSVLNRLGVMSKVSIPAKQLEEPEEPFKNREVPSVVKIKPRIIPHDAPQANKNLLLKAVAEAQRSIAQTPKVGNNLKPDALFTKKYKEKLKEEQFTGKKLPEAEKNKIKKILVQVPEDNKDENMEYVPAPVKKSQDSAPKYIPSTKVNSDSEESSVENGKMKQQFIVTLDGIEKTKYKDLANEEGSKPSIKSRLDKKKSPSPIIFDKITSPVKAKPNIPDKLPIVHAPPSVKNKERCKYWPSCRQGDKCEFVHPSTSCDKFPHCKFGDKCLFLHPTCKFGSSCTRRDCVYSHSPASKAVASRIVSSPVKMTGPTMQTCKFFPNCTNVSCTFYHPKPCKFGKYCKNQAECNFSHTFVPNKSSLTWRSK
ncbi:zinc finger CCCH domain-containing protein 14 [Asbolus verrucosus]|uniref:Zinc finger CCCH domain-containing protein 14 n=1 Tax=Asbolus verrucosus TaxID=1661398 RepID=A0A482V8Y1_ASBVE|nr:zinc finger CCCH domain-containing protein 14 [Asbolus verrucosus]